VEIPRNTYSPWILAEIGRFPKYLSCLKAILSRAASMCVSIQEIEKITGQYRGFEDVHEPR
jgi:hypothetical protein